MSHESRTPTHFKLAGALVVVVATSGGWAQTQAGVRPTNDAPNPYRTVENYLRLPDGRTWGATCAVDIDKDGSSIWVAERCGGNSCLGSNLDPILKFDASGKLVKSFGAGMIIFPHGLYVDREGNVWVTDGQDNAARPARGEGAGAGGAQATPPAAATKGHQVFKFSPDGKLLMTLGKPGGGREPDFFFQPTDVLVAPNGEIFISEGHGGDNARILKFTKDGKPIKTFGTKGTGPGEFDLPHTLAMDSKGRLFVGDRNNNRIQIFDQNGAFIDQWLQFSRPSGLFIDKQDNIYVVDSESGSAARNHPGWNRGMRSGNITDAKVTAFIPDPDEKATATSAAEGVAVDEQGNIYGAEVGPRAVKKYVKK